MKIVTISLRITWLSPTEEGLLHSRMLDRQVFQPGPTLCSRWPVLLSLPSFLSSLQSQASEHSVMPWNCWYQRDRWPQDRSTSTSWWTLQGPWLLPIAHRGPTALGLVVTVPAHCILWVFLDGNCCLTAGGGLLSTWISWDSDPHCTMLSQTILPSPSPSSRRGQFQEGRGGTVGWWEGAHMEKPSPAVHLL